MKKYNDIRPPRFSHWLLKRLTFRDEDFSLIGDFEEEFYEMAESDGVRAARKWYRKHLLRSLPSVVRDSISGMATLIRSYLKLARRHLFKHKFFSLVNIAGLAVGLACCTVIIMYVTHELTYDSHHRDSERIFRINTHRSGGTFGEFSMATTPATLQPILKSDYPQVESVARLIPPPENADNVLIQYKDKRFIEKKIYFADPEILSIFRIPVVSGQTDGALDRPNTVMISQTMARKYFGDENPIGKLIRMELDYDRPPAPTEDFEVTAVMKDSPTNTHIPYNMLISFATMLPHLPKFNNDWMDFHAKFTYVKLKPGHDPDAFAGAIQPEAQKSSDALNSRTGRDFKFRHILIPITSIHMYSDFRREPSANGNWYYIYIYSIIALLILTIGCMNFMNLSAVLSSTRTREVGMRKVTGAFRRDLVWQFLGESFLITLVAFGAGFLLVAWFLSLFNQMAGTNLTLSYLNHPVVIGSLLGLLILVTIGAGYYPAFILSSFNPIRVVRGKLAPGTRGSSVQKLLVVGQFAISIFLAICTLTVYRQLGFMKGQALGFDRDQKIILKVNSNTSYFRRNYEAVKSDLLQNPYISAATVSSWVPGDKNTGGYNLTPQFETPVGRKFIRALTLDYEFLKEYGISMISGRGFKRELGSDIETSLLLNESAVRELGFSDPEDILGKKYHCHYNGKIKTVVGVVKDVYFRGMREKADPLLFDIERSLFNKITLRVDTFHINEIKKFLEERWEKHFPGAPFEFSFLDDDFNRIYYYEEKMGNLLGVITGLGLVIACLGLLGLVSFMAHLRQKEMGIRKVLGASIGDVVQLISRQFLRLVFLASVIALPLAWFAMNRWLQDFVRRIELGPFVFILTVAFALMIALVMLIFQGIRVSSQNPIESIRCE